MATISAAGIGSGLDVQGILEQIVEAERAPTENRLNIKEAELQAELTAFGTLKGAVSSFQSSLTKLKDPVFFNSHEVSVSNTDVLSASASSVAQAGNYSVEVSSLAKSHSLASIAFDSLDDVIGTGTLTFNFGTTDYDPGTTFEAGDDTYTSFTQNTERSSQSVVIDNSNNTISGIRDAINEADIGVSASIVDDGSGYRLLLTSDQQGLDNSLEITVDEGGAAGDNIDTTGLSVLAFNSSATNIEQTQAAQDAQLTINGLSISRESNTVTGAIHGVTLNLLSVDVGNPVEVSITSNNVSEAETNITNFVNAYNELAQTLNGLTEYNVETGQGGALLGDNTARSILREIREELGSIATTSSQYNSLSSIGITTNRDGTLSLDTGDLNDALEDDYDAVARLFYPNGVTSDSNVTFLHGSPSTQDGVYRVYVDSLATPGQLLGEAVSGPITIDASNDTFSLIIDGTSTTTLSLTQAVYNDMDDLAQEIESRVNSASAIQNAGLGVSVVYQNGRFEISSSSYGEDSTVEISSYNTSLGFTTNAVETEGNDVVGNIGSVAAVGGQQLLTGAGAAAGLVLQIEGTTAGERGSVTFSMGMAARIDSLLSRFLDDNDGQIASKTESIENQIENINEQRADLVKRVAEIEERYRRQFAALDLLMGQLQTTSDYLQQQLDALPTIGKSSNS